MNQALPRMAGGKGGRRQVTRTVPSPAAHVGRQGAEPPAWLARSQAGLSAPQAAAPTTPRSPLLWSPPPLSPSWLFLVCFPTSVSFRKLAGRGPHPARHGVAHGYDSSSE